MRVLLRASQWLSLKAPTFAFEVPSIILPWLVLKVHKCGHCLLKKIQVYICGHYDSANNQVDTYELYPCYLVKNPNLSFWCNTCTLVGGPNLLKKEIVNRKQAPKTKGYHIIEDKQPNWRVGNNEEWNVFVIVYLIWQK